MGKDVSCNWRDCNVNIGFRIFAKIHLYFSQNFRENFDKNKSMLTFEEMANFFKHIRLADFTSTKYYVDLLTVKLAP